MGKGHPLHQIADIACLRGRGFQKFPSGRRIVKNIPDKKGGALRSAHLLPGLLLAALNHIAGSQKLSRCLRNHFHLAHSGDAGQRLAPETQRGDAKQILHLRNLAGGMAKEGGAHLIRRNPFPVIRNPDQRGAALLNLHRNGVGSRVDGVLHQLLHHGRRPLNHLSRRDFIDGALIEHRYFFHSLITICFSAYSGAGKGYLKPQPASGY